MNWTEDEVRIRNLRVFGELEKADWPGIVDLSSHHGLKPKRDEPEALIQAEATKLLEEDGWRALRTDPVSDKSKGRFFGEEGMADHCYFRYEGFATAGYDPKTITCVKSLCQVLWIEWKRSKGGVVSKRQWEWHCKERARGALTLIAGRDFEASVEGFRKYYKASGLQRREDL